MTRELGMGNVIFETDCLILKHALVGSEYDFASFDVLVREAKSNLILGFLSSQVEYCPRSCNSAAHVLAAKGALRSRSSPCFWLDCFPDYVVSAVAGDLSVHSG